MRNVSNELSGGAFVAPVKVNGAALKVTVDTGAGCYLSIGKQAADKLKRCEGTAKTMQQIGANGERRVRCERRRDGWEHGRWHAIDRASNRVAVVGRGVRYSVPVFISADPPPPEEVPPRPAADAARIRQSTSLDDILASGLARTDFFLSFCH